MAAALALLHAYVLPEQSFDPVQPMLMAKNIKDRIAQQEAVVEAARKQQEVMVHKANNLLGFESIPSVEVWFESDEEAQAFADAFTALDKAQKSRPAPPGDAV